jgi:hypothetical protein
MKTKLFVLLVAAVLGFFPQISSAAMITGWNVTIDNTMGSAEMTEVNVAVFEDGVFDDGQTVVIEIVKEFTSPDFDDFDLGQPLFLRFEKISENAPSNIVIVNEHITNSSVVNWYDFHMGGSSHPRRWPGPPRRRFRQQPYFHRRCPRQPVPVGHLLSVQRPEWYADQNRFREWYGRRWRLFPARFRFQLCQDCHQSANRRCVLAQGISDHSRTGNHRVYDPGFPCTLAEKKKRLTAEYNIERA